MMSCALFLAGSLLTGCGASGKGASMDTAASTSSPAAPAPGYGVADNAYPAEIAVEEGIEVSGEATSAQDDQAQDQDGPTLLEEKLVYRCALEIETLDYPGTMASIKETIARYDGVIQSESETDSSYDWYHADYRKTGGTLHNYLKIRIPSKSYESFLSELDGVGKVISKSTSVDNISQEYYDTATQIEALQIQEKNLLAMLEKCETIEDMITVEERLTQVQYELNGLQTHRRYMDMDVAYSYVDISISEVMEYRQDSEPVRRSTFVDRLGNTVRSAFKGFLKFLEVLLFLFIYLLPYLIVAAVICLVFFRKPIRKFMAYRKEAKRAVQDRSKVQPAVRQPVPGTPPVGMPATGAPVTEAPVPGTLPVGMPATGAPTTEVPVPGTPATGMPVTGMPMPEMPETGAPATGMQQDGPSASPDQRS